MNVIHQSGYTKTAKVCFKCTIASWRSYSVGCSVQTRSGEDRFLLPLVVLCGRINYWKIWNRVLFPVWWWWFFQYDSVDQFERAKEQRTNENTSRSEEAKVGLADEAITIVSSGQKDRVKRRDRFCKSLGTWQWVQRCLQWLFCSGESLDPLRFIGILSMHICSALLSFVCFLCPATLTFVSFFVFPILPDQLQEKPSYRKIISPPRAHCQTQGCFGDSRVNFTARLMVVNFPNAGWLSDLETQLKAFVGGLCLRSNIFFLALFSNFSNKFFHRLDSGRHFKELQLKGNFFDCT